MYLFASHTSLDKFPLCYFFLIMDKTWIFIHEAGFSYICVWILFAVHPQSEVQNIFKYTHEYTMDVYINTS